jgi:hypothetical protein
MTGIDNVDCFPSRLLRNALSRADGKCYTSDRHPPLPQSTLGAMLCHAAWQLLFVHASIIIATRQHHSQETVAPTAKQKKKKIYHGKTAAQARVSATWTELLFRFYFYNEGGHRFSDHFRKCHLCSRFYSVPFL